ncbi:MAG: hypothetical protein V4695_06970 [Pseudomonadota bacterium]
MKRLETKLLTTVRHIAEGTVPATTPYVEVGPGNLPNERAPRRGTVLELSALGRPGVRGQKSVRPVSIESLPSEVVDHIATHLETRGDDLKAFFSTTHSIRASLEQSITADKLCYEAIRLNRVLDRDIAPALLRIVEAAKLLYPVSQTKILCRILDAILIYAHRRDFDICAPLREVLQAAKELVDPLERYRVTQAASVVMNHQHFYAHALALENRPRDRRRLEKIYVSFVKDQIDFLENQAGVVAKKLQLQEPPTLLLGRSHTPANVRAKIAGDLASSLYLIRDPARRMAQWLKFFSASYCAQPEGRVHLLEGLADALHNFSASLMRESGFYQLLPEIAKLPQRDMSYGIGHAGLLMTTFQTDAAQLAAFKALRRVADSAPAPVRVECIKEMVDFLETSPPDATPSIFASLLVRAEGDRALMRAPQITALAEAIRHLPEHARNLAFQNTYRAMLALPPELQSEPAAALASALADLAHDNYADYQLRFADMMTYAATVAPSRRKLLVENMVAQLEDQAHQVVECLDYRDVLELVAEQSPSEQVPLLETCYQIISTLDHDWMNKLLEATNRVADKLPPRSQAILADDAARVAKGLDSPFLFAQFQRLVTKFGALPQPYATQALTTVGDTFDELIPELDSQDFVYAETQGFALPDVFTTIVQLAEKLPHAVRVDVMERLATVYVRTPARWQGAVRLAILMQLDGLSIAEFSRITALLPPMSLRQDGR